MLRIIAIVYLLVGIGALLLIPASAHGWLGIEADPLSGIFALLLALPWSLVLMLVDSAETLVALTVCAIGIGINFWLLIKLAARRRGE
ncbi:SCO4225 family membrane protein [Sphingomicrobium flavum]|uniref:SCO4225 family membrane protein n=1 Tax=Sphingomicrobium flavum TaxID=1229164 RepID=UPI0021ADD586|nr:hypothetical protein [Sphingomicrobium flavum]